jgi:hypothetical protein
MKPKRAVQFFLDSNVVPLELMGDGLLPPDVDGKTKPKNDTPAPIVGTQDDGAGYGATFDALNIWDLNVLWNAKPLASLTLAAQLPVASFDSIFPCGPSRGCIPQPGSSLTSSTAYLTDSARPSAFIPQLWDLRFVRNDPVVSCSWIAGMRWYEIRRTNGVYSLYQQGTYAPNDGVHRWMGSVAGQERQYGVGIQRFGRRERVRHPLHRPDNGGPLGQMTLSEGVIMNNTGVQTTTNSRWGDYTSMSVDPVDDCLWYQ